MKDVKLSLNKEIIAELNNSDMKSVLGGVSGEICLTYDIDCPGSMRDCKTTGCHNFTDEGCAPVSEACNSIVCGETNPCVIPTVVCDTQLLCG